MTNKELSYNDIAEIVEYLVKTKSHQNTFDCYDQDDISQEIRLICLKALEHFDVSKVRMKLVNFFGRCVDNALKNLKRDNYIRYGQPCNADCAYLHGDEYLDSDLAKVCKRWIKYRQNLQNKINIKHPVSVDTVSDSISAPDFEEEIETKDLKEYLISQIDDELRPHLINILEGDRRDVPANHRHKIQRFIKKIMKE